MNKWEKSCVIIIVLLLAAVCTYTIKAKALEDNEESEESFMVTEVSHIREVKPIALGMGKSAILTTADELISENSFFTLYLDKKRMVIKLMDKSNGFIWSSGLEEEELTDLTSQWRDFAQSLLVLEYLTEAAPTTPLQVSSFTQDRDIETIKTEYGFRATLLFPKAQIQAEIIVELTEYGFSISVPDESIVSTASEGEKAKLVLSKIFVLPFFGARKAEKDANGYLFVPDGCGAVIGFGEAKNYSQPYNERVYGRDIGVIKENVTLTEIPRVPSMQINYPVFGIVNGIHKNAFLAIIDQGDAYAELIASPAGVKVDYFYACPKFVYREAYFQSTGSGTGFSAVQKENNIVNARVEYHLLHDEKADYVGMALTYQEYLIEKGILGEQNKSEAEQSMFLADIYMTEAKKSLFGYSVQTLTTVNNIDYFLQQFKDKGILAPITALKGFDKNGLSRSNIRNFEIEKKAGSKKELKNLYDNIKEYGGQLLLSKNIVMGFEPQISKSDLAYRIDSMLISAKEQKELFQDKYFVRTKSVLEICNGFDKFPYYKRGFYLEGIGNTVVSDYRKGNERSRIENMEALKEALEKAKKAAEFLLLDTPNAYALMYADAVSNIPNQNSQYLFETGAVPFVQTLLSGYLSMYSVPMNFGTQTMDDVLHMIDYNMYPSYVFTSKNSSEFQDTNINDIYSSRFDDLIDYAAINYHLIRNILMHVQGQRTVSRTVVETGISLTKYENGLYIIVNYTEKDMVYHNQTIEAKTAKVLYE